MMIYKYQLALIELQFVTMPENANVLSVGSQNGIITVWARVDPTIQNTAYAFYIVGTGGEVPENSKFIGTVQQNGFVWHVFQELLV